MSTSPIPPDPYAILGVVKDADLAAIRTAHRKLALKFHPDRIKDEALREQGKTEFQKVQQAYEILSDPARRSKYDDQINLAELRREKMMRETVRPTTTSSSYATRPAPGPSPSVRREMRDDGNYYEERSPQGLASHFAERDRYEEPTSRASARKPDAYERRTSASTSKTSDKRDLPRTRWDGPVKGVSMKMAFHMKEKAQAAKERSRETHARTAKARDKEERRERNEKAEGRRTAIVDDASDSDSDTEVPLRRPAPRESKPSPRPRRELSPEPIKKRSSAPSARPHYEYDESESEGEKWERHHKNSRDYIAESQKQKRPERPGLPRSGSHVYWEKEVLKERRTGSDGEKRPSSSPNTARRSAPDEARARPSMPTHNSEPRNLKPQFVDREPQRSKTSYPAEPRGGHPPGLSRSQTMPVPRSSKKDSAPPRSSNLKHGETPHDSGYGSSSSPHAPEMGGESPPRDFRDSRDSRDSRDPRRRETTTRYQFVDPPSEDDIRKPRVTKIPRDDDSRQRRYASPEDDRRDRVDDKRERERAARPRMDPEGRSRSARAPYSPVEARPSFTRTESARHEHAAPRDSPPVSRHHSGKLYGEKSPERENYNRRFDPSSVKMAPHRTAATANYSNYRTREEYDDPPGSRFNEQVRHPQMGSRRPSVY